MLEERQLDEEKLENENLGKVEKQLTDIDPEVFEGISKQKRERIIKSLVVTMHKTHTGPLPDPDTLAQYSTIIPNGAERIMQMAEKQLDHRMNLENKVVSSQMLQSNIGQFLAFFIGIAALTASTICIIKGHEWSGSLIGIGGLTGLVTAFIKGRSNQHKNLEERHPSE